MVASVYLLRVAVPLACQCGRTCLFAQMSNDGQLAVQRAADLLCIKALLSIAPLLLAAGWSRILHNDGLVLFCLGLSLSVTACPRVTRF